MEKLLLQNNALHKGIESQSFFSNFMRYAYYQYIQSTWKHSLKFSPSTDFLALTDILKFREANKVHKVSDEKFLNTDKKKNSVKAYSCGICIFWWVKRPEHPRDIVYTRKMP